MVFEAIKALKERNGSSIQAIKKHITTTYPTLNFAPHQMRSALKKGVESGKFIKVRLPCYFERTKVGWQIILTRLGRILKTSASLSLHEYEYFSGRHSHHGISGSDLSLHVSVPRPLHVEEHSLCGRLVARRGSRTSLEPYPRKRQGRDIRIKSFVYGK